MSFYGLLYDDLYDFIMGTAQLELTSDGALVWIWMGRKHKDTREIWRSSGFGPPEVEAIST